MPRSFDHWLRRPLGADERRQLDGEDGARSVGAVAGGDRAVHRLDEATADRKAKAGAGTPAIGGTNAIELVEDVLQIDGRNARAFVHHLHADTAIVAPGPDRHQRSGRCVFAGVVEQIEQHLLEQYRIDVEHRQVRLQCDLRAVAREDLAHAAQGAADHVGQLDGTGVQAQAVPIPAASCPAGCR